LKDRTKLWLAAYVVFVVYGSLVPLDYQPVPFDIAWHRFSNAPFLELGVESRADWIANGVLYAPLALLATLVLGRSLNAPWWIAALLAWVCCVALAFAVEFAQVYFPPRTVSRNDLLAEAVGSAIGAAAAPWIGGWLDRIRAALPEQSSKFVLVALQGYLAVYLAFCFFPFDLLVSGAELQAKARSGMWGWLFAPSDRSALIVSLKLFVELLLSVPIGILLARLRPRIQPVSAALAGFALGLAIELAQFLLASGVSQGTSVLARAAGVVLGVAFPQRLPADWLLTIRLKLRRLTWPVLGLYLPLLAFVSGLLTSPWHGWSGADATWKSVRLLPFYYHYFTSEAIALFSLASVSLMYLPLALLGWANRLPIPATLVLVTIAAIAIEACKLFVEGLRPDPTNVLIAFSSAWVALLAAQRLTATPRSAPPMAPGVRPTAGAPWLGIGTIVAPLAIAWSFSFPSHRPLLFLVLSLSAVAVWTRPVLALAIVPAALPVLDLAPWTGRFYLDEFDLLQAVCLSLALQRTPNTATTMRALPAILFGVVGISLALGAIRALVPFPGIDANSFSSYYSPFNALRILKGALWAIPFVILWGRTSEQRRAHDAFTAGMAVGLAWTVAWVLWERATFAGLTNFASDFRVSGPFSAMHKGGAYLECYLAVAAAFVLGGLIRWRHATLRALLLLLIAGASYATMVTYSRAGYAAFGAAMLLTALTAPLTGASAGARSTRLAFAAAAVGIAVVVALPVLSGSFARERLASTARDLSARQAHWQDALAMRHDDVWTTTLGEGLGRFPDTHFWRSQERTRAASYRVVREGDTAFLRLAPGATLYVEQLIDRFPDSPVTVDLRLRSRADEPEVSFSLCRKWLLTSLGCVGATSRGQPGTDGWRQVRAKLDPAPLAGGGALPRAPLTFSLFTPSGKSAIDVAGVRLRDAKGIDLLANGDFASGLDRWFFTTDVSPPWYIDSLPVTVLFDLGWFGALAWGSLILGAIVLGARAIWRGDAAAPEAWAALVGFLVCGALNTLIDTPRFLWLFLIVAWLTTLERRATAANTRASSAASRKEMRLGTRRADKAVPVS
jgi:VanZ family protein/glycopeptide antibiotics resistance protein